MPIGLNLSGSREKVSRANVHLESLLREVEQVQNERKPFTGKLVRDGAEGCWAVILRADNFNEPQLGVILGDFIHNLRSALDYIITGLVNASPGAELNNRHQFPIFDDPQNYADRAPRMLEGITVGLEEVRRVQPFNGAEAHHEPLFAIQFFSNSDKHRVISQYYPVLHLIDQARLLPDAGIIRRELMNPPAQWRPGEEFPILRVCYAPPYPADTRFEGNVTVIVHFGAQGLPQHGQAFGIPIGGLRGVSDHVTAIIDSFERL